MKRLDMQHRPHETCYTFSTLAKAYNMKDNIRRLIMEHAIVDFTDRVYTHPTEHVYYNALEFLTGSYWKSEA